MYTLRNFILILAFLTVGCGNSASDYYERPYEADGIPPPAPRKMLQESKENTYEVQRKQTVEKDTSTSVPVEVLKSAGIDYFKPGTHDFKYIFDVRSRKTTSVAHRGEEHVSMSIDIKGNITITDKEGKPFELLVPSGEENIKVPSETTIYEYQAYWLPPSLLPEVKSEWYSIKLYYFSGKLMAVRVGPSIFSKEMVGIEFAKDVDVYSDEPGGNQTYIVKRGDNLNKIARAFNTTVEDLKKVNGLTSDRIITGQKLKLW